MPDFDKSRKFTENYNVTGSDGEIVRLHEKEVGDFRKALERAVDPGTGYGTQKIFNERTEVEASSDGVTIRSKQSDGWHSTKLNYRDARAVVGQIEDRMVKEALVEGQENKHRRG